MDLTIGHCRRRFPHVFAGALLLVSLAAAGPAQARSSGAPLNVRAPLSGTAPAQPGVRSAPATAQALAATLQQATGLSPSEVTVLDACPPVTAGYARCNGQVLALRADHKPVRPRAGAGPTFTHVFPTAGGGIAPSPATATAAGAAPLAGTPAWLQQAYDLSYLSQTAGGGDTVAIVDAFDDPYAESDLATYRSTYGLPACTTVNGCFRKLNQSGQASPLPIGDLGWEMEISLDVDAVSALCPNCHILLVEATDNSSDNLSTAEQTAASLGAEQISNSFAAAGGFTADSFAFPGVAVIAATGDSGYNTGGADSYPASLPGVTAAGGTSLAAASGTLSPRGFTESAWSGGGSGCALGEQKPSYQIDTGCTGRSYADVSADADPDTGLRVRDAGNGGWLMVGGTSLSSPLIAAYEALTIVDGSSPRWAYSNSALLNDPVSGSTGTCPSKILYICNAGVGYDGPTGAGSISGAVAQGAPGIGGPAYGPAGYEQSATPSSATLLAGVYPNGLDSSLYWQYGTSGSYGQQAQASGIGSGRAPVSLTTTLAGLAPSTTYHYRLVARNAAGTAYGYDYTFSTLADSSRPAPPSLPIVTGVAAQGQTLGTTSGTWTAAPTAPPPVTGTPQRGRPRGSNGSPRQMNAHISAVHRHGARVTLSVNIAPRSGKVTVIARRGRRTVRLRVKSRSAKAIAFTAILAPGRWSLMIRCKPAPGYAAPKLSPASVSIPRA